MEAQPPRPPTGEQPQVAPQTVEQQLDGVRAWVAQVDRKLGIRTYAGAAALVLALAAGIVGVVLAVQAKDDSATKDEVSGLRDQIQSVSQEAVASTRSDLSSLSDRLDALETKINSMTSTQRTTSSELDVAKSDIEELRNQISDLEGRSGGGEPRRPRRRRPRRRPRPAAPRSSTACSNRYDLALVRPTAGLRSRERLLKGEAHASGLLCEGT
jgi:polyhydroxyalkanoate synthesis regulator phasin